MIAEGFAAPQRPQNSEFALRAKLQLAHLAVAAVESFDSAVAAEPNTQLKKTQMP